MDKEFIDSLTFHSDRAVPPNLIHSMDATSSGPYLVGLGCLDSRGRMYSPSPSTPSFEDLHRWKHPVYQNDVRDGFKKAMMASCYGGSIHDAYEYIPLSGWKLFKCHVCQAVNILTAKKLRASLRAKLRRLAAKRLNLYTSKTCVGCDMCMHDE